MFEFEIDGVTSKLDVTNVHGTEGMSKPFAFDVDVRSGRSTLTNLVGEAATLTMSVGGVESIRQGIIERITALEAHGSSVRYRVRVVPALAALALRSNRRVFQDRTAEEVITALLDEHSIGDVEIATTDARPARPFLVQYGETDLDFVQRLIDEDGLFYFFEHRVDGHTMIISDDAGAYRTPSTGPASIGFDVAMCTPNSASRFEWSAGRAADTVTLRDYDFTAPSLDLEVTESAAGPVGTSEIYEHPGGYSVRTEGERRAAWRLAAERLAVSSAEATTNSARMMPGHTFVLTGHPVGAANTSYAVVSVVHRGEQDVRSGQEPTYENTVSCLDPTIAYRTTGSRPAPIARGPQTAVVVGPAGEEIHVDEHGRVKVQFRWDRAGALDENSSAWIRVAQASSGNTWGSVVIPRIGQEVLVDFIDGDPDRPVIVGSLYNGDQRLPYELPEHKNLTVFKTRATPGGGAYHEVVFDDTAGAERVQVRSARDLEVTAVANSQTSVGVDETIMVGGDRSVDVGGSELRNLGGDLEVRIGGDQTIRVADGVTVEAGGDAKHTIGKSFELVAGADAELRARSIVLNAVDEIRLDVGRSSIVMKRDGSIAIAGTTIDVAASANLRLKGPNIR